ncbi:MAG: uracil-DNA glycosylase family protein [bacterium]
MTHSLSFLRDEIRSHPSNAWTLKRCYEPVFQASPFSRLAIIGQAPGSKAQESLLPWNDASGDTLRTWLSLSREEFYDDSKIALVPMDFYYPGKGKSGDLPPRKDFAPLWHPRLFAEMPDLKLILLVGSYSQGYYLDKRRKENLTETVRSFRDYLPQYIPLVHPSPLTQRWRRQNPWFEEEAVPEIREIVQNILF